MWKWVLPYLLGVIACNSESLAGKYQFQNTIVVSELADQTDCGIMGFPSAGYDGEFTVAKGEHGDLEVTEDAGGCVFQARSSGDRITATNSECVYPADSSVRAFGLYRRVYSNFVIDVGRHTWAAQWENWSHVTAGLSHECAVGAGRQATGHSTGGWLRYEGTYGYTPQQAADQGDCGEQTHSGSTSGFMELTKAADRTNVYWEGFGCTLEIEGADGAPLTTTDAVCSFDGTLAKFALASVQFRTFALDVDGGTLSAEGLITRSTDPALSFCFSVDATVAPSP
jgi:hypothetical protein